MKDMKIKYKCNNCGYISPRWLGKCPQCNSWNCFEEYQIESSVNTKKNTSLLLDKHAVEYTQVNIMNYVRQSTGIGELDRVLGGGLVTGSVVLLAGEPGIGKSTLLMQITDNLGKDKSILYVSGEESASQLHLRAARLQIQGNHLLILTETSVEKIVNEIENIKPDIIIIDSIQTMYSEHLTSSSGSVSQVKESAFSFISIAKTKQISFFLVGHVNKEGGIAGPKVLEHMVDAVLYFEGERHQSYRIIRATKNRYGSTNEIGVFEMTANGLSEVLNPSLMLLDGRPQNTPGNCAFCSMEGTRPIIAEIQALVTPTVFPAPRRTSNGIDYNRLCLILAVLEKRLGQKFSMQDVYINVIGGLHLDEPACDLSVALALLSSLLDRVIPDDLIAVGEIGLSGECRSVSNIDARINEAERLGFKKIIVPSKNKIRIKNNSKIEIIPVDTILDTIKYMIKT